MKDWSKVSLFKYLTVQEIDWLRPKWHPQEFNKDMIIIKEGTVGDEMYLIESGEVEIFLRRGEFVLNLTNLGENEAFGELALLTGRPRSATVKAKTNCRVLSLKKEEIINIMRENPPVAAKFLLALSEEIAQRMIVTTGHLENYFLINRAIIDNETFRNLYIYTHKSPPAND